MPYRDGMTKRFDQSLDLLANLSIIGLRVMRADAPEIDKRPPELMDSAHRQAVDAGRVAARLVKFATDDEMDALFRRAGL